VRGRISSDDLITGVSLTSGNSFMATIVLSRSRKSTASSTIALTTFQYSRTCSFEYGSPLVP